MKIKAIFKTVRPEIKAVDAKTGIIDMLIPISTTSEDRDHETISADAWTKRLPEFMKRPILIAAHDYWNLKNQIGEFVALTVTDVGLLGKPRYYINEGNEEADWAFNLASKGMAAYSVGFIPWEVETDPEGKRNYTDVELLEISHVIVPSNRDAIQGMRSAKDPVIKTLVDDYLKSEIKPFGEKRKREISQSEIEDQLDYTLALIKSGNINEGNKKMAEKIVKEITERISGSDMPVEIKLATRYKKSIENAMETCRETIEEMDSHHKDHNKSHMKKRGLLVKCHDELKALIEPAEQKPEEPEEPETPREEDDEPEKSINAIEILTRAREKINQN